MFLLLRCFFILVGAFSISPAFSQDVTGIWRGTLTQGVGGCYPVYYIELQVDKGIMGHSYSYYDSTKFVKLSFSGYFDPQREKLTLSENSVLEYRIPPDCVPCIKTYDLVWHAENGKEFLSGDWHGKDMSGNFVCPPGKITLERVSTSPFTKQKADPVPVITQAPTTIAADRRRIELVKTIVVDTLQLTVELYDSGQVDGDTVTLYLNRELVLFKKRLSEQPIILHIPIQPGKDYELVMYADNLGSIPPNTALMVVRTARKKTEVYLSSTEQKSAAVKFRYER